MRPRPSELAHLFRRVQAELHVFGAAQQVVRNVFREKIQDDMLQVHDFKHLIVKELGAEISDAVLVELFEEVGFIIGQSPLSPRL